ncbi:MAG: IclR family transcriptional regulator [Proteobacteria bacterium]|nr:IclR family transcriptional regulator [Pseudomonadota bacterium]
MDKDTSPDAGRNNIQVLSRAASILRALEKNPGGMSLGEISKAVELPRSTVQRIVDALDRESLVIASTNSNGVRLGPALIPLAAATRFQIADLARQTLEALAKDSGETVVLVIADQDKVVQIDQVISKQMLSASSPVGQSFPLNTSAAGKAILATFTDAELAKTKKRIKLARPTKNSIFSWEGLEKELKKIRETGVAYNFEENIPGICAIASALRSPTGDVAAIAMTVPTQRFNDNKAKLAESLLHHCNALRSKLTV